MAVNLIGHIVSQDVRRTQSGANHHRTRDVSQHEGFDAQSQGSQRTKQKESATKKGNLKKEK